MNSFDKVFRPEKQWSDICLTDTCPCDDCATYKDYERMALYGTPAERQYAELPESCKTCMDRIKWEMACIQKTPSRSMTDIGSKDA